MLLRGGAGDAAADDFPGGGAAAAICSALDPSAPAFRPSLAAADAGALYSGRALLFWFRCCPYRNLNVASQQSVLALSSQPPNLEDRSCSVPSMSSMKTCENLWKRVRMQVSQIQYHELWVCTGDL